MLTPSSPLLLRHVVLLTSFTLVAACGDIAPNASGPLETGDDAGQPTQPVVDVTGSLVLLGGTTNTAGVNTDEMWRWNGSAWTRLSALAPGLPTALAAPGKGTPLLFTMIEGTSDCPCGRASFTEAFAWTGSDWTLMTTGIPTNPGGLLTRMSDGLAMVTGDATWESTGSGSWDEVATGPRTVTFAEAGTSLAALGDTLWSYDGSSLWHLDGSSWEMAGTTGPSLPARTWASMAPLGANLVLFGGGTSDGGLLDDTWTWDGNTWTQVNVGGRAPPPRMGASVATLGSTVVLFGGWSDANGDTLSDTWTWDGTTWTQDDVSGPPARAAGLMAALP